MKTVKEASVRVEMPVIASAAKLSSVAPLLEIVDSIKKFGVMPFARAEAKRLLPYFSRMA